MYVVFSVLYAVDAMERIPGEEFINFRLLRWVGTDVNRTV
jgi:hypothetical protein